jgi:hypothetical protein
MTRSISFDIFNYRYTAPLLWGSSMLACQIVAISPATEQNLRKTCAILFGFLEGCFGGILVLLLWAVVTCLVQEDAKSKLSKAAAFLPTLIILIVCISLCENENASQQTANYDNIRGISPSPPPSYPAHRPWRHLESIPKGPKTIFGRPINRYPVL